MKLAANTLHYHVKQLVEAGVLLEAGRNGRNQRYQALSKEYIIPNELVKADLSGVSAADELLATMRARLGLVIEERCDESNEGARGRPSSISSNTGYRLEPCDSFPTVMNFSEIKLTNAQYDEFTETVAGLPRRYNSELKSKPDPISEACNSYCF